MGGQARLEMGLSTDGSDDTDGRAGPPGEMSTDGTRGGLMADKRRPQSRGWAATP
jgi:hypothetical protein